MQRRERKGVILSGSLLYERRSVLQQLQNKREELFHRLNALLADKQKHTEQEVAKQELQETNEQAGSRLQHAKLELARAKAKLEKQRQQQASKRAALEARAEQLLRERTVMMGQTMPQETRTLELRLLHARLGLVEEQRAVAAALLDILPLRVMSLRSGSAAGLGAGHSQGTLSISLCGLRIPESLSSQSAWWQQQPMQLSAVLGYMLLLLDLLAAYLGGPLLHEGSFQGCTSVVWQQQSFWNRRPTSSNGVLPLFMEQGLVANAVAPLTNTLPTLPTLLPRNPVKAASSAWSVLPALRAVVGGGSAPVPATAPAPAPGTSPKGGSEGTSGQGQASGEGTGSSSSSSQLRQRHADLRQAFDMLMRSASCLVRDRSREFEGLDALPHSWSPFSWLTMLCSAVLQDDTATAPRLGGVLNAAAMCVALEAQAGAAGAGDGEDADGVAGEEEEGWDVVRPVLPPPPSESEDVEQYARALYADGNAKGSTVSGTAANGATGHHHHHHQQQPSGPLGGLTVLAARTSSGNSARAVAGAVAGLGPSKLGSLLRGASRGS